MVPPNNLGPDLNGKDVNKTQYRGMIGSLMYLKGTPSLGLWYLKCLGFNLKGYLASDYTGCNMDKKSASGAYQLLGVKLVCWSAKKQYHFIRDYILKGDIELHLIPTQYQLADIFTKPLYEPTFKRLIVELDQVEFTFNDIAFTTNNEVALLYPSHPNQEYFKDVSDFISKCCLKEAFTRAPTQYKEYLSKFWFTAKEDLNHKLNKKTREKIVPYSRFISLLLEYMAPKYDKEKLTINPTQVFSVHNWILKPNQPEEPPFTEHMLAVCNLDDPNVPKAPKPSIAKRVPQGINPGAKPGHKKQSTSSKQPYVSSREATKDTEMNREDQQAAGGPSSLGATSKEGAHPQLSSGSNPSVLVDKTKSAGDGLKTAHTTSDILKDTRPAFFTPNSPTDKPIIVSNESKEEEDVAKDKDTKDTSVPPHPSLKSAQIQKLMALVHLLQSQKEMLEQAKAKVEAKVASLKVKPSYPDINQLMKMLVTSLKHELSKLFDSHDFTSCLPTELKELPSKITEISGDLKPLKQHVRDMEIELLEDLKKLQTLDSLLSLFHKMTDTLNRFSTMMDNASGATSMNVPSVGQATTLPAEGEKNTKDDDTNLKDELIDLLGKDVVTQYYTKKLLFDKYYDKMLKRKKN
ncbi:hypothetical protein Tco_1308677, partial [Tanacetum coccineum]